VPQTLTISNVGGSPIANVGFSITGAAASSYSIAGTTCGALLNNGSSCTVQIVFTPSATGAIAATLIVSSSTAGVVAVSVPLNGSGQLTGGLTTNPSQIAFPVVAVGLSSAAQILTVTNSSSYAIGSVSLAVAAPFSISQNTCTGSLAAGANCTAAVVFQPSVGGPASGMLTVNSSAVAAPVTVALSGTGFDFSVGITGSATQSVAAGQTASYTLQICGTGGCAQNPTLPAGGTFSFQCGSLPANAACTFNPATETVSSGAEGNILVGISTGNAATARLESPGFAVPNRPRLSDGKPSSANTAGGRPDLWHSLPLACGLLLIPLVFRRRRKTFLLAVLAAFFTCGVSSCVSSGGGTGGNGGKGGGSNTPSGTYAIPISVTSTGITRSVSVTLTVD
jgi:hypothetical protein